MVPLVPYRIDMLLSNTVGIRPLSSLYHMHTFTSPDLTLVKGTTYNLVRLLKSNWEYYGKLANIQVNLFTD
jgi:hypothetical protein